MELIKQTHPALGAVIHRWGCVFMALLAMVQWLARRVFTPQEVLEIYHACVARNIIGNNCYVHDNNAVIALAWQFAKQEGKPPIVQEKSGRFARLQYRTSVGTHFVIIDSKNDAFYNPDPSLNILHVEGVRFYG
ncbi:DUF261 family protein [Entomospira culicis]|uniref:DUF261 family protein n=1 Tax=Entomospira culicis TaxID=2719989 RepID=A0A968GFW9_9SPIO|nr:DUF261 family protein [Entomospira culicis]NIZ19084.1 DUF261 family protein [Entomospira culicis]NIZ69298.1 DUF261 family protein [Entomospira culicis]WDI37884.1 DUF261 family protein [Entomospira culicis]WDI39511.1 DUF261 family protein [Entomospira culicis]